MQYDLVFEGGGAKGMVFVGALEVFEAHGHTTGRLLGTSAGAITAALAAAGYHSAEMVEALGEQQPDGHSVFSNFLSLPLPLDADAIRQSQLRAALRAVNVDWIPDRVEEALDDRLAAVMAADPRLRQVFAFVERGGLYGAENFLSWLRRRLDTGSYQGKLRRFSQLNLAQFFDATGVDLSLIAADTTAGSMLVLNHRTAPELPLVWAVRMSMSLPLLWEEVTWRAEWGRYRGLDFTGHAIVDGGLLSNFPIELFVSRDATVTAVMGPKVSQHVLGLMIDESLPVPGAKAALGPTGIDLGQLRTVRRVGNLLNTALSARDKMVAEALEKWVIRLPAKGYGTVEFDMSAERREALVNAGRLTMQAYLQGPTAAEPVIFGPAIDDEGQRAQQSASKLAKKILSRS